MRWDMAIDLGTENVRAIVPRADVEMEVGAYVAFREGRQAPICGGDVARGIRGKACRGVTVRAPLKDGALEDEAAAEHLLRWLIRRADPAGERAHPRLLITCAPFTRPSAQQALAEAAERAGATVAALIRSDAAVAIGAGLSLNEPEAKLVVDLGAGKMSASLFTFGRTASFSYLPYGIARIDERIASIVRTRTGYRIGLKGAQEIKHTLGSALPTLTSPDVVMHMSGFSISERVPRHFDVETKPVLDACEDVVRELIGLCASVMEHAPEELSADLNDFGAVLAGGGALLTGLDKRIGEALGIPCRVADSPSLCALKGLKAILENPDAYEGAFLLRRVTRKT